MNDLKENIRGCVINSMEILCVGTELLMGQTINTNAAYLSKELSGIGVPSFFQSVVGDNHERLESSIINALNRCDAVIMTGGLGPTKDDISMEVMAKTVNLSLVCHEESKAVITAFFKSRNRPMSESNLKQAMLPEGGIVLPNDKGTAPGAIVEVHSRTLVDLGIIIDKDYSSSDVKTLILLPGPPKEMKAMFDNYVRGFLVERAPMEIRSEYVKLFGIGESQAEKTIRDLIDGQTNPTIAPYCSDGECMFRVSYSMQGTGNKGKDESVTTDIKINGDSTFVSEGHTEGRNEKRSEATRENAKREIDKITKIIASRLGEYVYEIGDRSLPKVVFDLLAGKNTTISFAESCTGGLLTSLIADIPGASLILKGSVIAYSNDSKANLLGVSNTAIKAYGAVSEEVAKQMASGCRRIFSSDCAVSVTGIAGPDGGSESKPVGLVYIGISTEDDLRAIRLDITGDRSRIRYIAALNALDILRREFN